LAGRSLSALLAELYLLYWRGFVCFTGRALLAGFTGFLGILLGFLLLVLLIPVFYVQFVTYFCPYVDAVSVFLSRFKYAVKTVFVRVVADNTKAIRG